MPNATLRRLRSRSLIIPTGSCSGLPKICAVPAIEWWGAVQHHIHGLRNPNLEAVVLPGAQVVNLSHHPGDDRNGGAQSPAAPTSAATAASAPT
jgi:hypothetical protein